MHLEPLKKQRKEELNIQLTIFSVKIQPFHQETDLLLKIDFLMVKYLTD